FSLFNKNIRNFAAKTYLSLLLLNITADVLYNLHQFIRPQMRLLNIEDLLRRTCPDKNIQHFGISSLAVFYQSIQFPVGKSAGSSLSKLNVTFRIQLSCFPELVYFFHSPVCIVSSFQKNGPQACTDQIISTE